MKQAIFEEKLLLKQMAYLTNGTTIEEVYGPLEDWQMNLDEYQFLLDPVSGTWLFFDRVHDTWDTTGFMAGEVTFVLEEGELIVKPNPEPTIWPNDRRYKAAEGRYWDLCQRLYDGAINQAEFTQAVESMTLKDRQGRHWRLRVPDGHWTWWNGRAWVAGEPQRENLPVPNLGPWQKFAEAKWRYFELWNQKEAGKLSEEAFMAEVNQLRVQDQNRAWWQVRAEDGAWLAWDGRAWVEGQPDL